MSSIIIPRKWQTQPRYRTGLDRSNPFGAVVVQGINTGVSPYVDIHSGAIEYTPVGTQTYLASQYGVAFTGTGSSCLTSDIAPRINPYSCSFAAWVIPAVTTTAGIASSGTTSGGHRLQIDLDGGNFRAIAVGDNVGAAQTAATANIPVHLCCVFSGTASRKIYINGVLKNTNTTSVTHTGTFNRSNFGALLVNGVPYQTYLTNGSKLIDPIWLNRAFSDYEVAELARNHWQIFRKNPQVLYFDVGGAGAQTLTPSLVVDGDTFHAATVSAGAVTLTPSLYSDGDTFHSATVSLGGATQDLTPALFADGDIFHSATVSAGSVNLAPSLVTDGDTFHAATVAPGSVTLTPSLVTDGDTFYTHAVVLEGGPQTLSPDLFADGDTFHAATVTPGAVTLTPSLYTDADTFHAAEIASGFNLQPPAYADPDTFYPATVDAGAVSLTPDLFVDGDAFYTATVANAGVQTLEPGLMTDADTFYVPTVIGGARTIGAARSAGRQIQTGARSNIQTNRR